MVPHFDKEIQIVIHVRAIQSIDALLIVFSNLLGFNDYVIVAEDELHVDGLAEHGTHPVVVDPEESYVLGLLVHGWYELTRDDHEEACAVRVESIVRKLFPCHVPF